METLTTIAAGSVISKEPACVQPLESVTVTMYVMPATLPAKPVSVLVLFPGLLLHWKVVYTPDPPVGITVTSAVPPLH